MYYLSLSLYIYICIHIHIHVHTHTYVPPMACGHPGEREGTATTARRGRSASGLLDIVQARSLKQIAIVYDDTSFLFARNYHVTQRGVMRWAATKPLRAECRRASRPP